MESQKQVNIGVVWAGVVGSDVVRVIDASREELAKKTWVLLGVTSVFTRTPTKESLEDIYSENPDRFVWSIADLYNDPDISIIVETMWGIEDANTVISNALSANKSVVTANKDLIATHGADLISQANESQLALRYEAAVAGWIPVVNAIEKWVVWDTIKEIRGIMNGTCNYMLTELENGWSYEDMLKKAQELWYAESDPTNDVEGIDTAYKLAILISLGFWKDANVEDFDVRGISGLTETEFMYAKLLWKKIKLLGVASQTRQKISAYVSPVMLDKNDSIAKTDGVLNAVHIVWENATTFYNGPGAGWQATASAIVSDVMNVARFINNGAYVWPKNYVYNSWSELVEADEIESRFYCRFYIDDRPTENADEVSAKPWIVKQISGILEKYSLNIEEVRQHEHSSEEKADLPFVITLEKWKRSDVEKAMKEIDALSCITRPSFIMPNLD